MCAGCGEVSGVSGGAGSTVCMHKGVIVHFIVRAVVRSLCAHCSRLGAREGFIQLVFLWLILVLHREMVSLIIDLYRGWISLY